MQAVPLRSAIVPSPAVLRFLKIQADFLADTTCSRAACSQTRRYSCWSQTGRGVSRCARLSTCVAGSSRAPSSNEPVPKVARPYTSHNSSPLPARSPSQKPVVGRISSRLPLQCRAFSTTARDAARVWPLGRQKPATRLQPDDLPPLSGFLDDSPSLTRINKPTDQLRLRCTEFNERGDVTLVHGEFKKSELIAKVEV